DGGRVTGVTTTRGDIRANKVAHVAAGHRSVLAAMVGLRLPLQSPPLQARVVRAPAATAEPPPAGPRVRAARTHPELRGHVERRPRLREPGRQGRAGDGRGDRRVQLLHPARLVPCDRAPDGRGTRAVPDVRAGESPAD